MSLTNIQPLLASNLCLTYLPNPGESLSDMRITHIYIYICNISFILQFHLCFLNTSYVLWLEIYSSEFLCFSFLHLCFSLIALIYLIISNCCTNKKYRKNKTYNLPQSWPLPYCIFLEVIKFNTLVYSFMFLHIHIKCANICT